MATTLYVLRHGETAWSLARRHTGRTDIPLTDRGREQATAAGALLRSLRPGRQWAAVLTSPLQRAAQTAHLAGVWAAVADDRLVEWDYGRYEGVTTDEIRAGRPEWILWRDGCPDGEQVDDVARRVDGVLAEVAPALDRGDVLLVAHSHLLRVVAARWLGLSGDAGRLFVLDPAGLGMLGREHGGPAVTGWNVVPPSSTDPAS